MKTILLVFLVVLHWTVEAQPRNATLSFHPSVRGGIVDLSDETSRELQSCISRGNLGCQPTTGGGIPCCNSADECRNNRCVQVSNTCAVRFETCLRTSDCCPPWHCRSNQCDTVTAECSPLNGFCTSTADCCTNSNLRCNTQSQTCVRAGVSDCVGFDQFCSFDSDCCGTLQCNSQTGRCDYGSGGSCTPLWQSCVRTSDCCSPLHCRQNLCDRASCGVSGQTCRNNGDCCVGTNCNNGICGGGSNVGCTSLNCNQCLNSGSQGGTQSCAWSPSAGCLDNCNQAPADSSCYPSVDYSPQGICPNNVGCSSLNCNQCLNSGSQGGTQACAWIPSVGCRDSCAQAPADSSCYPSTSYSPQGICPGTSDCKPLNAVCDFDSQCCNSNICQGRRCVRSGSGSGCTSEVGASCVNDSDCCGPNFICDRAGAYCRYG